MHQLPHLQKPHHFQSQLLRVLLQILLGSQLPPPLLERLLLVLPPPPPSQTVPYLVQLLQLRLIGRKRSVQPGGSLLRPRQNLNETHLCHREVVVHRLQDLRKTVNLLVSRDEVDNTVGLLLLLARSPQRRLEPHPQPADESPAASPPAPQHGRHILVLLAAVDSGLLDCPLHHLPSQPFPEPEEVDVAEPILEATCHGPIPVRFHLFVPQEHLQTTRPQEQEPADLHGETMREMPQQRQQEAMRRIGECRFGLGRGGGGGLGKLPAEFCEFELLGCDGGGVDIGDDGAGVGVDGAHEGLVLLGGSQSMHQLTLLLQGNPLPPPCQYLSCTMGPKKEPKKEVVEEPPKVIEPEIPLHELQGTARFDYPAGATYTGEWKLFRGVKLKHGRGTLTVQPPGNALVARETYEGQWEEDQMHGEGTYHYSDGGVYRGNWQQGQRHGEGTYEFGNGTVYEGGWKNQLFHGSGVYIDCNGRQWRGEFRRGVFESGRQAELQKERALVQRKLEIRKEAEGTVTALLEALARSDKKTLKDNLAPFFPTPDLAKEYLKEPYPKFDQRPPEKWTELLTTAKSGDFRVLSAASESAFLGAERILGRQLEGNGQVVEVSGSAGEKSVKLGLLGVEGRRWVVAGAAEEDRKK